MMCHDATRTMSEEQERTLELGEQVTLQLHLAVCPPCRNFRRQVAFLRESMRTYARRPDDVRRNDQDDAGGDDRDASQ
jgi:predicted anti-sigma-YlaC factor YlaD